MTPCLVTSSKLVEDPIILTAGLKIQEVFTTSNTGKMKRSALRSFAIKMSIKVRQIQTIQKMK